VDKRAENVLPGTPSLLQLQDALQILSEHFEALLNQNHFNLHERGNPCLNRVMCDFRSTLDVTTVDALMRISLNGGSPANFHSSLLVARWLDSGERAKWSTFMN
ncbi:unnamed protein product, partial [Porites lobata]